MTVTVCDVHSLLFGVLVVQLDAYVHHAPASACLCLHCPQGLQAALQDLTLELEANEETMMSMRSSNAHLTHLTMAHELEVRTATWRDLSLQSICLQQNISPCLLSFVSWVLHTPCTRSMRIVNKYRSQSTVNKMHATFAATERSVICPRGCT